MLLELLGGAITNDGSFSSLLIALSSVLELNPAQRQAHSHFVSKSLGGGKPMQLQLSSDDTAYPNAVLPTTSSVNGASVFVRLKAVSLSCSAQMAPP